jgi:hypothetical protein
MKGSVPHMAIGVLQEPDHFGGGDLPLAHKPEQLVGGAVSHGRGLVLELRDDASQFGRYLCQEAV